MNHILTICAIMPLLVILCWKDCKYRMLPNIYTLGLAILGLIWRFSFDGVYGLIDGVAGGIICAAFLFIPFLMKGAGGGDLKMIFATGIFVGMRFSCAALLFISLSGLIIGLIMMILGKVNSIRLKHHLRSLFDLHYDRKSGSVTLPPKGDEKGRIPFGVAIAIGTILTLLYAFFQEIQL